MRIEDSVSLAARTTLGLGGTCTAEVVLEETGDLEALPALVRRFSLPVYVLGAGSNVLAMDGRHELLLLRPAMNKAPFVCGTAVLPAGQQAQADCAGQADCADQAGRADQADSATYAASEAVLVRVAAGTPLPQLLAFCRREGLTGLEGLAGIPGRVGGAIAMNAGSFGSCMGDHLASVDIWAGAELQTLSRAELELGYRHFAPAQALPGPWFVTGATLALARTRDPSEVGARMAEHLATKKARQPVTARSAGCVFKNPPQGPSAGILLDRAGFKGKKLGGVAFSTMHANFLVNEDKGTASDAVRLLDRARERVAQLFNTELELEVQTLPWRSL